jgi:hypothetical protein
VVGQIRAGIVDLARQQILTIDLPRRFHGDILLGLHRFSHKMRKSYIYDAPENQDEKMFELVFVVRAIY